MKIILMFFLCGFRLLSAKPEVKDKVESTPDIGAWIEELNEEKIADLQAIKLAFVMKKDGKKTVAAALAPPESLQLLIGIVSKKDLQWNLKINQEDPKSSLLKKITKLSNSNSVFEFGDVSSILHLQNSSDVKIALGQKDCYADPKRFWETVMANLGFNGMILDRKDRFVLVADFSSSASQSSKRAAVFANSQQSIFTTDKQTGALLQSVTQSRHFAIFELLMGDSEALVPGGKINIEHFKINAAH